MRGEGWVALLTLAMALGLGSGRYCGRTLCGYIRGWLCLVGRRGGGVMGAESREEGATGLGGLTTATTALEVAGVNANRAAGFNIEICSARALRCLHGRSGARLAAASRLRIRTYSGMQCVGAADWAWAPQSRGRAPGPGAWARRFVARGGPIGAGGGRA